MWQAFLRENYASREEWEAYSETYGLAERLGYATADEAWDDNPYIQGGVNPGDFGRADLAAYYGKRMRHWTPERLAVEQGYIDARAAEGYIDWARKEVKDAWCKAVAAEVQRRLTP